MVARPQASFLNLPPELHLIIGKFLNYYSFHSLGFTSRHIRKCYAPLTQSKPYFQHTLATAIMDTIQGAREYSYYRESPCPLTLYTRCNKKFIRHIILGGPPFIQRFLEAWYAEWWSGNRPTDRQLISWRDGRSRPPRPAKIASTFETARVDELAWFYRSTAMLVLVLIHAATDTLAWFSELGGNQWIEEGTEITLKYLLSSEGMLLKDIARGYHRSYKPAGHSGSIPFDELKLLQVLVLRPELEAMNMNRRPPWPSTLYSTQQNFSLLARPHIRSAELLVEWGGLVTKPGTWNQPLSTAIASGDLEFSKYILQLHVAGKVPFPELFFVDSILSHASGAVTDSEVFQRQMEILQMSIHAGLVPRRSRKVIVEDRVRAIFRMLEGSLKKHPERYYYSYFMDYRPYQPIAHLDRIAALVEEALQLRQSGGIGPIASLFQNFRNTINQSLRYAVRQGSIREDRTHVLTIVRGLVEADMGTIDFSEIVRWALVWAVRSTVVSDRLESKEYAMQIINMMTATGKHRVPLASVRAQRIEVARKRFKRVPELWGVQAWAEIEKACRGRG
ncbi:hypothetical protein BJ508DRAFT_338921 [Ascobolus immersus RN42]|uniref:F-box domain-containing protein n=1 Tax=Ascobolus immersus RN42 TaxID=1160509 RepID=A0A3N4IH68_ASCIM|nr:hypothetical protein BJ508DRAFT_338921 [Ascobolus immersus RN42]